VTTSVRVASFKKTQWGRGHCGLRSRRRQLGVIVRHLEWLVTMPNRDLVRPNDSFPWAHHEFCTNGAIHGYLVRQMIVLLTMRCDPLAAPLWIYQQSIERLAQTVLLDDRSVKGSGPPSYLDAPAQQDELFHNAVDSSALRNSCRQPENRRIHALARRT